MSMYTGAKTVVRTVYGNSSGFEVKVGMHQGSALSQLLFVIVMEVISREFRVALPWELLYADDFVVMGNGRFPDNQFNGQTFPGQDVSRKDVSRTTACPNSSTISRTRRFPDNLYKIIILNILECSCSKINDELSCAPCTYMIICCWLCFLVSIIIFLSLLCQL